MTLSSLSSLIVPSTLRSGRAPAGSAPSSDDVDADRAAGRRRVDARDPALDDAVAGVDLGVLADPDVLGLRFRDPQFGLQVRRIGDAGEVGARADLCADFDRHLLQHAGHAGLDLQVVELRRRRSYAALRWSTSASCGASCDLMPCLVISSRCCVDRRGGSCRSAGEPLLLDREFRDQALLEQRFVGLRGPARAFCSWIRRWRGRLPARSMLLSSSALRFSNAACADW